MDGVVLIGLATIYGFIPTLRSPKMMVAELESATDENGIPADYRAKALSRLNTNITLVLFVIAVSIQLLVTNSLVKAEVITRDLRDGIVNPYFTAEGLGYLLLIYFKS